MDHLKKVRAAHRTSFTKTLNELNALLNAPEINKDEVAVTFEMLQEKMAELDGSSAGVINYVIQNSSEAVFESETASTDEYKKKYVTAKQKVANLLASVNTAPVVNSPNANPTTMRTERKKFKMPTFEVTRFSGNVKDWLKFWNQFRKIHEDDEVDAEDKFQMLLRSVEIGSRAYDLVSSFPPTRENYPKAIDDLRKRFGKDEIQVEVYVRELLNLVLHNALNGKEKLSLSSLFDKLRSHMRALETLGVTSEKCASMLFPLVESAIPEGVLRAWQRSPTASGASDSEARMKNLMEFLSTEVEGEERIQMAASGFSLQIDDKKSKRDKSKNVSSPTEVPTAMGLLAKAESSPECIFCKTTGHWSQDCNKAKRLSLSDRRAAVRDSNCCFNCLRQGHNYKRCKTKLKCAWCAKRHVLLMCPENAKVEVSVDNVENIESDAKTANAKEHNLASFIDTTSVYLQTLRVKMINGAKQCTVRALIDSGSQRSYITDSVAISMGYVPTDSLEVSHSLFGGARSSPQKHNVYKIHLRSLKGDYACNFDVMNHEIICEGLSGAKSVNCLNALKANNITLSDYGQDNEPIGLLIGADVVGKLFTGRRHNLEGGLTAIETHLGWTIVGKDTSASPRDESLLLTNMLAIEEKSVPNLWRLDILGIEDPVERKTRQERMDEVKKMFQETTYINSEGRYEVKLPWILDHPPLSSNKAAAIKRLEKTMENLRKNNLCQEYDEVFYEWERDGVIERVPESELNKPSHYLPHRPVVKLNSNSTKIRPVFDASAHEKNHPSLNQCLETGPNLIERIPSIVLRFRLGALGAIADIKRAYLQISVTPEDRDYLRFLLMRDGKIVIYRHKRVVFGVTSSSFILGATIELHAKNILEGFIIVPVSSDTVQKLMESFYSDNCVVSVDSQQELLNFMKESTCVLKTAGFDLSRWEYTGDNLPGNANVLGILWNKEADTLSINLSFLQASLKSPLTKRLMLSIAHRIFDPVGSTCPVTLYPKLLLQRTWKENIGWDDKLPDQIEMEFEKWLKDLPVLNDIKIPRKIATLKDLCNITVHAFSDASQTAYAAAVFMRVETADGVNVQLIGAKGRIAPTKNVTIPRLELLAATITARLARSLVQAADCEEAELIFWSDSTTVLSWINREAQWSTFVWNRVREIKDLTGKAIWRHVPGVKNPADLPSRGCSPIQLVASKWWEGPEWLRLPRSEWPAAEESINEEEVNREMKRSSTIATAMLCKTSANESGLYLRYFSSYIKIVKMIAWIYRFFVNSKTKNESNRCLEPYVSSIEVKFAEMRLLRLVQSEMFVNEKDDKLKSLNVFKDENGILRIKTKIFYRDDDSNFRCPILLDSAHPIVRLIIQEEHLKLGHAGIQTVLCSLRENYWILSARRSIRSVLTKCIRCKRYEAKRMEVQSIPLPVERVRDALVFEIVGVDLAGPLYLKGDQRAYICIFTCAVYRAVHFELLSSLSTPTFIKGLCRFIARRGRPSTVFSDNGTNFVGTENELKKLNWKVINEYSSAKRIEWRFNPPSAAWWGGWWERMVRLVKNLLRRILSKASVGYEDMLTILCDCESIINARPLTYISSDCDDLTTLTPNMFLQGIREMGVPDLDALASIDLREKSRYCQKLKDDLRERFRSEYLGQLRENSQSKFNENRQLRVGDLVLVGNDDSKRIDWPLGRVISEFVGRDGHFRVYRVKTKNGEINRPAQRLYPLEIEQVALKEHDTLPNQPIAEIIDEERERSSVSKGDESKTSAPAASQVSPQYVTRSGREVKRNRRYE